MEKIYYAVVPQLYDKNGDPLTDLKKFKPAAIVWLHGKKLHAVTMVDAPFASDVEGRLNSKDELEKVLEFCREENGERKELFDSLELRHLLASSEKVLIETFFDWVWGLDGEVELHTWNSMFDIDVLKNVPHVKLRELMDATREDIYYRTPKNVPGLCALHNFHLPTDGKLSYVDGVTTYGIPINEGRLGGLNIANIFSVVSGFKYVPYWYRTKDEVKGIEQHRDLFANEPFKFLAEEFFTLFANRFIVETYNG